MASTDRDATGVVFNIQKYSVHDGPGIRTIAFLKGCPLSCRWCSNPESQNKEPELARNAGRCIGISRCGRCIEACPKQAISAGEDDTPRIDRTLCAGCTIPCAAACPSQGLLVYGKTMSVGEVLEVVEKEAVFYRESGGLTLSGGEPLMQGNFALSLLREAKRRRLNTAIETSGFVRSNLLLEAVNLLDTVIIDLKHTDPVQHSRMTGVDNAPIMRNISQLATTFPEKTILVRTPIIPGFNDTEETIEGIADFLLAFPNLRWELLPYHRLGTQKYLFLDREYMLGDVSLPKSVHLRLENVAKNRLGDRVGGLD